MRIPEENWLEYVVRLARLCERAGQEMAGYLAQHGTADAVTAYAFALVQKYAEGSAELACQMYDAVAEAAGMHLPPAMPAEPAEYGEVAGMVHSVQGSAPLLQSGVKRFVKQAGADTTLQNALRDGAEFAWVPHGDTCPFCIALASRGWQRISKKALKNGHAEHIHPNCDCEYAVRFDGKSGVAGYDPDKYLAQYNAAGGDINALRRAQYAKSRERINTQKRAAYAARVAKVAEPGIIEPHKEPGGENEVHTIGKIDPKIYQCITSDIPTTEVIITDERIQHIKERHPGDYERFVGYMTRIVSEPDYIIGANKPGTAVLLKFFVEEGEKFKLILRLKLESDPANYKNSVISFWRIGDTTWKKTIKNKQILYKRV